MEQDGRQKNTRDQAQLIFGDFLDQQQKAIEEDLKCNDDIKKLASLSNFVRIIDLCRAMNKNMNRSAQVGSHFMKDGVDSLLS